MCENYKKFNSALMPCGHATICHDCSKHLDKCPICRVNIDNVARIYLP